MSSTVINAAVIRRNLKANMDRLQAQQNAHRNVIKATAAARLAGDPDATKLNAWHAESLSNLMRR